MRQRFDVWRIMTTLMLLAAGAVWGQNLLGAPPNAPAKRLPTLAVTVAVEGPRGESRENVEDLLLVELAHQPYLQLVDRQALASIMKEHAIALSNLGERQNSLALGKFAGADYLLHVLVTQDKASLRLAEVATGHVKLEEDAALSEDLTLSSAAIRERVLAAIQPQSQAANRLTVGIAAFPNRSGTARSDEIGIALQKVLRSRLKEQPWAVVLERQYPTALLEEIDLARIGLVRDKAIEKLPPADLVILGTVEDVSKEYVAGKSWEVRLNLILRLRGQSHEIILVDRSDAVETAADRMMRAIDEIRQREPKSDAAISEKELWRHQALYLMPPRCETWADAIVPNFYSSTKLNRLETIRAWQNVLLLDANDLEAMTYLGVCMVGFSRSSDEASVARCVAGTRLVERAFRSHRNQVRADTLIACLPFLRNGALARAKELAEYISSHPELFNHASCFWVKEALNTPVMEKGDDTDAFQAVWKRVIQNAAKDPDSVLLTFSQLPGTKKLPLEQAAAFLTPYVDSPDPVVEFVARKVLGQWFCRDRNDTAGLGHFDKAIEVLDKAYPRCRRGYSLFLSNIYQLRIEACQRFGRSEEAKKTALDGARHFMKRECFDDSVAWLYHYCVTEALGAGQEREALAICDAYLAAFKTNYWMGRNPRPFVAAKREELLARRANKPAPDTDSLRLIKGTEGKNLRLRMAATDGKLWLVSGNSTLFGQALLYRENADSVSMLPDVPHSVGSVTAMDDAVFFGGYSGLYKLDTNGKLLKHYDQNQASMPGGQIYDVCEGGGKLYFVFQGSPYQGIAVLDPTSDKIAVLAPSRPDASRQAEPRTRVFRLRWDAVTPQLYACCYVYWHFNAPTPEDVYRWTSQDDKWYRFPAEKAPLLVVSDGGETIIVNVSGEQTEFRFMKAGEIVRTPIPLPQMMGEPAWDEHRIWVPTASGLYEIDRATGRLTWLAYEVGNHFRSLLKAGDRLYVATSQGLYYREIAPAGASEGSPTLPPSTRAKPAPVANVTTRDGGQEPGGAGPVVPQ